MQETKPSFLKLGGLDAAGAAGEKSVIIATKHRHCYPLSLRTFRMMIIIGLKLKNKHDQVQRAFLIRRLLDVHKKATS